MIDFDKYFAFPADQVECITRGTTSDPEYPVSLTVYLKSGRNLTVNYRTEKNAENVKRDLMRRIENSRRSDYEQIYNKVYLIEDAVRRIDKRQLKIWRQLRDLLGVKTEGAE